MTNLCSDQKAAIECATMWAQDYDAGFSARQYFALAGAAGTGKSTTIRALRDTFDDVLTLAMTGKACNVLQERGIDAETVHSRLFLFRGSKSGSISFARRRQLDGVRLLIIDEASLVDGKTLAAILAFNIPVIFVGDHQQLEPIGQNAHLMRDPDFCLTEQHRQAIDNPIIRVASAFYEGRSVPNWADRDGRLTIAPRSEFEQAIRPDVQFIVGFNRSRHRINKCVRRMLGFEGKVVCPGDRLICQKNNYKYGLFNGQEITAIGIFRECRDTIEIEVETDDGRMLVVPAARDQFGQDTLREHRAKGVVLLDYSYAVTCHKAQGSEWPHVVVLEDLHPEWDPRRWRYTAVTRARETLKYFR